MAESGGGESQPTRRRDRPTRKYGFACANCRKRKARCDGGMPKCGRCVTNNENCYFDKAPSIAFAILLQNRIASLEALLEHLRIANDTERLRILEEHFGQSNGEGLDRITNNANDALPEPSPQSDESIEDDLTQILKETSVDEHGRVCFYGSTSLFHTQVGQDALGHQDIIGESAATVQSQTDSEPDPVFHIGPLPRNSTASLSTNAPPDNETPPNTEYNSTICQELLEIYWCWPHHLHLVLCRKLFMRDVASFGPYVTPFLFYAVLAQAARYSDRPEAPSIGQHFANRALESLANEIDKGSSISAIQGLLIFSARECGCGRTSQGWLYSGMAFRMMRDLGIHIHPRKLNQLVGQFTSEEMALRQQIFWSCYTWDKTLSLCLGRPPSIHDNIPVLGADSLLDGVEAEEGAWKPKFATSTVVEIGAPQKARSTTRFIAYCSLCVILDEVLETLYSNGHATQPQMLQFLDKTIRKLDRWKLDLPPHLQAGQDASFISCPPLHILLLNLLYHSTIILLCRPYRSTQERARKMATAAAETIDRLLMLHIRRFGFRVITYLESYTVFVASTINILDMKDGIDEESARVRLALNLEVLSNASSTPSNVRCVKIIEQLILRVEEQSKEVRSPAITRGIQPPDYSPQSTINLDESQRQLQAGNYSQSAYQEEENMPFSNIGRAGYLPSYQQRHTANGSSPRAGVQTLMNSEVERPLRWLSDNISSNFEWMMTGTELSNDLNNPIFPTWNFDGAGNT